MNIQAQRHPELIRLSQLVRDIPVAMFSSSDGRGGIASRPMTPLAMDDQGAFWFLTDVRSAKVDHLQILNLSFSNAQRATFVSLSGHGEIDADRQRMELLWNSGVLSRSPKVERSPHWVLLKFVPHSAEYWTAPGQQLWRRLVLAVQRLAGRGIALSEPRHCAVQCFPSACPAV
ncbi:MAG: pyridoxamine 5'-phosphate oxidase family protein [Pseudomonadota bacterium]